MERDNILAHGEEIPPEHNFVLGSWHREERYNYEVRTDVCSLCMCRRVSVRNKHIPDGTVSSYWRSGVTAPPDNMPGCWDKLNP